MLKESANKPVGLPHMSVPEHRLWQDELRHTPSLGCWSCRERPDCGGMAIAAGLMSCLDLCCGELRALRQALPHEIRIMRFACVKSGASS